MIDFAAFDVVGWTVTRPPAPTGYIAGHFVKYAKPNVRAGYAVCDPDALAPVPVLTR